MTLYYSKDGVVLERPVPRCTMVDDQTGVSCVKDYGHLDVCKFPEVPPPDEAKPDEQLQACPFCGMQENLVVDAEYQDKRMMPCWVYVVICGSCAAQGPWEKTRSGAIRWWNKRERNG